ncbi:peptidase S8/S53 domain-containing protein [Obelidium mucronatum]|nr:peptidase S8/S53 domain-containing protein [Obelidium mucronatum]
MKLSGILSSLLLAVTANTQPVRRGAPDNAPGTIDCAYMVHFPQDVDAPAAVDAHFKKLKVAYSVRTSIKTKLANFVSFQIEGACDADAHVATLQKATEFSAVTIRERVNPVKVSRSEVQKHPEQIHSITGVADARKQLKLTGKGVNVAVIDGGVYYLHPALGGGFGPKFKVQKGYDFVGPDYGPKNGFKPSPDADPLDECSGYSHGTHVAGIIAADASNITVAGWVPEIPFTGVAPEANIFAYRVFGCDGSGNDDVITAAIYKAAEDGAHILNLSLGGGPSYTGNPFTTATDIVSKAGHHVIWASGNDGSAGAFTTSTANVPAGGISVASFDNVAAPSPYITVDDIKFGYSVGGNNGNFIEGQVLDIVVNDLEADAKDIQNDGTLPGINEQAKGKALLIRWGDLSFGGSIRRCDRAVRSGAIACIIYNNGNNPNGIAGSKEIPSMFTSNAAGKAIIAAVKAGKAPRVVVSFKKFLAPIPSAGTLSSFSAPGLDNDLWIKPDIGGIGGQVLSTFNPQPDGDNYGVLDGTSMACPYVSGVSALLLQARGKLSYQQLKGYLQNNAAPAPIFGTNMTHSPAYQGAGLVNAFYAASAKTLVVPSAISLNDTVNHLKTATVTITNNYKFEMTYHLSNKGAATVNPLLADDDFTQNQAATTFTDKTPASLKFDGQDGWGSEAWDYKMVRIPAGKSATVTFKITPPKSAAGLYPLYGGYMRIVNDYDEHVINVPYAGVVGSWKDRAIWSRKSPSAGISTGLFDLKDEPISANAVVNGTDGGLNVYSIPTTTSRVGVIEAVFLDKNDAMKNAGFPDSKAVIGLYNPSGEALGPAVSIPLQRQSFRAVQSIQGIAPSRWNGTAFIDRDTQKVLPAGRYQILFRALKHFGNRSIAADWDVVTSPAFSLVF